MLLGIILRCGLQHFNATQEMAAVHGIAGAAHGPIGPDSFHLLALIGIEILAGIEALEEADRARRRP